MNFEKSNLEHKLHFQNNNFKCALPGLRQFFATESPLKMMKNTFYFTSKALFDFFGRVAKRLYYKNKVNFKIYDVTASLTNNCNTHTA